MTVYEDDCVGCPPEMGCLGNTCPFKNVPHYYCDMCGREYEHDDLREYEGGEICESCFCGDETAEQDYGLPEEFYSLSRIET